jgi:outer membrane autotransporter protein
MPAFGEKGDGLTKKYESSKSNSLEVEVGVLFAKEIDLGGGRYVVPHLNLGLAYETLDTTTSLTASFADQPDIPSFTSESPDTGRARGIVEVGAALTLSDNADVILDYKGSFRKKDRIHGAALGLVFNW